MVNYLNGYFKEGTVIDVKLNFSSASPGAALLECVLEYEVEDLPVRITADEVALTKKDVA